MRHCRVLVVVGLLRKLFIVEEVLTDLLEQEQKYKRTHKSDYSYRYFLRTSFLRVSRPFISGDLRYSEFGSLLPL